MNPRYPLPWLEAGEAFPDIRAAWPLNSDAPGLLAAGGQLDTPTLVNAYSHCIFPWFSEGQPILWWSPDPRMVLQVERFKLHRSLKKAVLAFGKDALCEIRIDSAFQPVIAHCAHASRKGQSGTWIVPDMVNAYVELHRRGYAHSVETWIHEELVGGLYCVAIGQAVFGESMFSLQTDASKLALAALVCLCREVGIQMVDCQQNTRHLASLGAAEMPRAAFANHVKGAMQRPAPAWKFEPLYWRHILEPR